MAIISVRIEGVTQDLVAIDGEALSQKIGYGESSTHCIDFKTGDIVPLESCSKSKVGEGRPSLQQGKRFIRIPCFDDLKNAEKDRLDELHRTGVDDDSLLPQNEESREIRAMLDDLPDETSNSPGYLEYCNEFNESNAGAAVALRWIASLRPTFRVGWLDHHGVGLTQVYEPARRGWVDAR